MTTYLQDSEGKFIPASQRPDGTWRKARRVKDGYIPQEEVPLYESKGKLFAKKPTLPVGMCPIVAQQSREEWLRKQQKLEKTNQQNPKQSSQHHQQQQQQPSNRVSGLINSNPKPSTTSAVAGNTAATNNDNSKQGNKTKSGQKNAGKSKSQQQQQNDVTKLTEKLEETTLDPELELAKKLKKLKKKIREIEVIEQKLAAGELKNPEKDQLDKVGRKSQILKEIEKLEKPK